MICNGNLAGLVAITGYLNYIYSPCDNVYPWAAFVIGVLGGLTMVGANKLLFRF